MCDVVLGVTTSLLQGKIMKTHHSPGIWSQVVTSAALGAAAMYMLDPNKGRRRRAIFRDKTRRSLTNITHLAQVSARDISHRVQGFRATALRLFKGSGTADDLVLIERVRAKMGRVVSHPHAIQIGARDGRITLSGPIVSEEVAPLLDAVRSVWGVSGIDDHLVGYDRPESIPSLQGGRHRGAMRSETMQEEWTPALRVAAVLGGGALAVCAMRQRGLARVALATVAVGLTARGAANMPLKRIGGLTRDRRTIELQKTIRIAVPREMVYDLWTDYENFPRFMSHVEEVRQIDDDRTHWVIRGPAGGHFEWNAVVTRGIRPEVLSWRTEPGAAVQHAGSVHFEDADGGTRVSVNMSYSAAGRLGHAITSLLGSDPKQRIDDDLARMKTFIEQGVSRHDAARPDPGSKTALH
jgi:uncharacterized membrane protein